MKKQIILVVLALLLAGCTKSGETVLSTSENHIEQHLESDSRSLYDYARYVNLDDEYSDAYKDYLCFRAGSYPVHAKLSEDSIESKNRIWIGNGYTMKVEFADDNIYSWTWDDEKCMETVLNKLEEGKKIYESVSLEDEELYKKYESEVFEENFFKDVMKSTSAVFEFYPSEPTKINYSLDLSDEQLSDLKDILHTATIDKTKDSMNASFTYTLSLFDRHGDYVFVITMDDDRKTMYVEDGMVESSTLKEFLNSLVDDINNATWE